MTNDEYLLLGKIDGKLDALISTMHEHAKADNERFEQVFTRLESHAKDINQAKGAKNAILLLAGGVSTLVTIVVAAAERILK